MVSAKSIIFGPGAHQATKPQVAIAGGIPGATMESRKLTGKTAIPLALSLMYVPSVFTKIPATYYRMLTSGMTGPRFIAGTWPLLLFDNPEQFSFIFGLPGKLLELEQKKSRDQDGKPGVSTPLVPPKTSRGTKPSKPTRSGSTSKPFWSSGKPKCKKGFRYDFKRKLCVKI
ncbi:MAG: hypothetical protein [Circular genetic element sp.]|nr:MAG: hypothetical protein [Circular genetic element sp.]